MRRLFLLFVAKNVLQRTKKTRLYINVCDENCFFLTSNYSCNKYSKAEYNLSSKCESFYDYKYTLLLQSNKIGTPK